MNCWSRSIGGFIAVLLLSWFASAQEIATRPVVLTSPQIHGAVKFDISSALRDAAQGDAGVGVHEMSDTRIPHADALRSEAYPTSPVRDQALQTGTKAPNLANIGLNLLGLGSGFAGYSATGTSSHVNLAVGATQVVQWANGSFAVFDKSSGAVLQGPVAASAFWAGFGGVCENSSVGDFTILWDNIAQRWLAAQNVSSSAYLTCLAVSSSPDFGGTYYRYAFPQTGSPDYSNWGVGSDAYYQAQNNFGQSGASFQGAYACAYDRGTMLAGDSDATQVCFQAAAADSSLLPADLDSAKSGAAGEPEVLLGSIDSGSVFEYLFHVNFSNPSQSTFTGANQSMPVAGVMPYTLACGGVGACIPQEGSGVQLSALSDRLMGRLAYHSFADHQAWVVSHVVAVNNSVGERWYELRAPLGSTTLSVYQQGTYAPDDNDRWMGAVEMDQAQNIALAYSVSGQGLYPSISMTGRAAGDAPGTMRGEASIITGSAPVQDEAEYSGLVLDSNDQCTFWYTSQYSAGSDWSTRLASFSFPGCNLTPAGFSLSASPTSLTIVQGNQATTTITSTITGNFNSAIGLSASGMPAGMTVSFNPSTIAAPGSGSSTMTVNVSSSTNQGSYPITVTGSAGSNQQSTTVTVNVNPPPSFSIHAQPPAVTVAQGAQGSLNIQSSTTGGFNQAVSLSVSGAPAGVSTSFSENPIPAPGSGISRLTFTVGSTVPTGNYTLTVTGTATNGTQSTVAISLTVAASFTMSASPASLTVLQGQQGTTTITTVANAGFNSSVSFSAVGVPGGTSVTFSPASIPAPGSGSSTMVFNVGSSTTAGVYTITVYGNGGGVQSSTTVTLTVIAPDFTLSASPSSQTINRGQQANYTVTVGSLNGFSGTVNLGVSGCPAGAACSFSPQAVHAPGSSTLNVNTRPNTPSGTYTLTISGSSGSLNHSTTVSLTVH